MNAPRIDGIDTSGYQTIVGDQPPLLFAIAKATEGQRTVDSKFFASVEHYQSQRLGIDFTLGMSHAKSQPGSQSPR